MIEDAIANIVHNRDFANPQATSHATEIPNRSLTASLRFCLQPMYCSVVCTEAWPSRNWICSSSPPHPWQRRAQLRRRSWGAKLCMPARLAHRLTAYQTTFAEHVLQIRAAHQGDTWWETINARLDMGDLRRISTMPAEERTSLAAAERTADSVQDKDLEETGKS